MRPLFLKSFKETLLNSVEAIEWHSFALGITGREGVVRRRPWRLGIVRGVEQVGHGHHPMSRKHRDLRLEVPSSLRMLLRALKCFQNLSKAKGVAINAGQGAAAAPAMPSRTLLRNMAPTPANEVTHEGTGPTPREMHKASSGAGGVEKSA